MDVKQVDHTFAMIKPDVVGKDNMLVADILKDIYTKGFDIIQFQKLTFDRKDAEMFYAEHKDRSFFDSLCTFMTSGPLIGLILKKENAIEDWRAYIGPTNSLIAKENAPHTLRAKYGTDGQQNAFHGSDSPESVGRELKIVFPLFLCQDDHL